MFSFLKDVIFEVVALAVILFILVLAVVYVSDVISRRISRPIAKELGYTPPMFETEIKVSTDKIELMPRTVIVTGYAPLDPNAKEGVCYSGDPTITASGSKVQPNRTIATDKSIPFGTQVLIEGFDDVFIVEDRGGKIKGNRIDVCFATQKEALEFGKKKLAAVFLLEVNE